MAKKIVAFGEVVWDILPDGKVLGGTPSNLAFRCNCFGERGFLLSRVGDDELGHAALNRLEELGISTYDVQLDSEFPTGTVNIELDDKYEPIYKVTPDVAFDHIEFSTEALKLARKADCLFYGLLAQRFGISKNTIRELIRESPGSLKFFDLKLFKHFFNLEVIDSLLRSSNLVRIKEKEIDFLTEKLGLQHSDIEGFGKQLVEKFKIDLVIITRGRKGVFAWHKKQGAFRDLGYELEMKDNIGSGMAFSAGFLHYYLNGKPIQEALNFGNAAGALNATKMGATSFFDKKDVLKFMKKAKKTTRNTK
ncbi:MAG TPA: PfkB family carbohydrate kinase [Tangfeifania sp.]|nr:PfkB family carbohydrate kinase [Tangfeifania sp.]